MALDLLGNTIKPGDTLCYPVRRGSNMEQKHITVTQVTDEAVLGYNPVGRRITVKNLGNCVVAKTPERK